jgi:hypothetical protein
MKRYKTVFFYVKVLLLFFIIITCKKENIENNTPITPVIPSPASQFTKNISYNDVSVDVLIDKPEGNEFDVLMVFHGTVYFDSLIYQAAANTLNVFKGLLENTKMMLVSVAYPEENMLMGDNILHCEAALLWLQNNAKSEIGVNVKKIFLAGHSQGGYIVTRLNTMHQTSGVIANAPGPLNLVYRCHLEETGQIPSSHQCTLIRNYYGTTTVNPNAYFERSLLNFTNGFKTDILFVQGLNDSPVQMYSWPSFKEDLLNCVNCNDVHFLELQGIGHNALFNSTLAKTEFNNFINSR